MRLLLSAACVLTIILSGGPARYDASAQGVSDQPPGEPIGVLDLLKLHRLGDVQISPDSREIVYSVTSIVGDDEDSLAYRTHLYLVDAGGSEPPRQLTRGRESATDPAWHPLGDRIAFVRKVDGESQIFVLPLLGGEAVQITRLASGATSPQWSPDGSRILFASTLTEDELAERLGHGPAWPIERPGRSWGDAANVRADPDGSIAEVRAWLDANADDADPRVLHRLDFLGEHDLEPEPEFHHFFVAHVDTVAEPVMITRDFSNFGSAAWLPDGERIVVSGLTQSDSHPDRRRDRHLYTASADGGGIAPLLEMDGYAVYDPTPSPNGRQLTFVARDENDPGYAQSELGVQSLENVSNVHLLTLDFDRSVSNARWSKDGWYVYFTAPSNGGVPLYRLHPFESGALADTSGGAQVAPVDTLTAAIDTSAVPHTTDLRPTDPADSAAAEGSGVAIERLTSFERGIQSFTLGRATVFYVASSVSNPFELYSSNLPFTSETQLTTHNEGWLAEKLLSYPEHFTLQRDGVEIDYWMMRPTAFDSTRRYPLLVQIHGGPSAMWGPGEASMWHEFQFFASKGYGIVFSNQRGSGGYGYEFKRANFQDWGTGPAEDVLAVASAAAAQPWVDTERQFVTGGSYAGYLTAWIVAHDHRFKAAVAQRGVYDLDTFLGEGNAWRLVPSHFGGFPWETDVDEALPTVADPTDAVGQTAPADTTADTTVDATPADTTGNAMPADTTYAAAPADTVQSLSPPSIVLEQNSPLTFVEQIRTPLLIIHADNDLRTGVGQSEMLYKSLKILERPVEYVRYPDAGHDLSRTGDPKQRMDRILRIYEFFERFTP